MEGETTTSLHATEGAHRGFRWVAHYDNSFSMGGEWRVAIRRDVKHADYMRADLITHSEGCGSVWACACIQRFAEAQIDRFIEREDQFAGRKAASESMTIFRLGDDRGFVYAFATLAGQDTVSVARLHRGEMTTNAQCFSKAAARTEWEALVARGFHRLHLEAK